MKHFIFKIKMILFYTSFNTSFQKTHSELLKKKTKKAPTKKYIILLLLRLIISAIKSIFKKHWHLLSSDPELSKIFQHPPLIVYKQARIFFFRINCFGFLPFRL